MKPRIKPLLKTGDYDRYLVMYAGKQTIVIVKRWFVDKRQYWDDLRRAVGKVVNNASRC